MENENKLPPEFKAKWVAALRSGEYKQCRGELFNGKGYCCLGVACVITKTKLPDENDVLYDSMKKIPSLIKGTAQRNPVVKKLASMNDGVNGESKHSFSQIADYIEENL